MGYYIEVPDNTGKARQIVSFYGGTVVSKADAERTIKDPRSNLGVIVIVHNPFFEAAGFAFSEREFQAFTSPMDNRKKEFVLMDKEQAKHLSGYSINENDSLL